MSKINQKLNPTQILQISNMLRLLGFKRSHIGTKLIIKSIQYIILNDSDFFTLKEIYCYLHSIYNFNSKTIKSNINNAILNRNIKKSKDNFQKVFNYEYDEIIFTSKNLIEEISNIINLEIKY